MHKSISSFLLALSLLPGVSAAAAPADNPALAETRWVLQSLDGETPLSGGHGAVAFVMLQAGSQQLGGFTGCNRLEGRYTQRGTQLALTPAAGTRTTCSEALMQQEKRFIELLKASDGYRIEGPVMSLLQGEAVKLSFKAWLVK